MNVLIYSGAGTTTESVKHCLHTFRRFLSPYYAVISVDANVLKNEPWPEKTSLLVFPGGADLPFCKDFNGEGVRKIKKFINKGGKYMGFCAGGYFGSSRCEFAVGTELEVTGRRELALFPGTARGAAYKGFQYDSLAGERTAHCSIENFDNNNLQGLSFTSHYNGGPTFVDADKYSNVEILSRFQDPLDVDSGENKFNAAVIYCKVGDGAAVLCGPHVEFDPILLKYSNPKKDENLLKSIESSAQERDFFLRACLKKLGLKVNELNELKVPKLTPLLVSSINPNTINEIMNNVYDSLEFEDEARTIINGGNDVFHIRKIENNEISNHVKMHSTEYEDPDSAIKDFWVFPNGETPNFRLTPYFSIISYFSHLKQARDRENSFHSFDKINYSFGENLMYGEILTSTSTLLEKNHKLSRYYPNGFAAIGTTQVSGRGRGGNVWISPIGTLAVSTIVRLPVANTQLSFIQYLVSMAMMDSIVNYDKGYEDMPVKLKWPNDIYIIKPEYLQKYDHVNNTKYVSEIDPIYIKIGGLLVNTSIVDDEYVLVIGCGINVSSGAPTTALNLVLNELNDIRSKKGLESLPPITTEKLAALYMLNLEKLFSIFKNSGFHTLLSKYYKYWLHTDQIVRLGNMEASKARIVGITSDYGLLKVEELDRQDFPTGKFFELQPDGNSFDMFKGLISKKARV